MRQSKLNLRREVLAEIETDELRDIVGADPTTGATRFSCLTYISCNPADCARTRNCV